MYEIIIEDKFSASHAVLCGKNVREKEHSHLWRVQLCIQSAKLDRAGMVMDFTLAKEALDAELKKWSSCQLGRHGALAKKHLEPTAENLAKVLFDSLKKIINSRSVHLKRVTVYETPDAAASYTL